jgi:hypothetical protein
MTKTSALRLTSADARNGDRFVTRTTMLDRVRVEWSIGAAIRVRICALNQFA